MIHCDLDKGYTKIEGASPLVMAEISTILHEIYVQLKKVPQINEDEALEALISMSKLSEDEMIDLAYEAMMGEDDEQLEMEI